MSKGERVLDDAYIFRGQHYLPGPGGFGVVDLNGEEIELPKDFPKEKLTKAKAVIDEMEARVFKGFNRVPTADSLKADEHRGKQPQDVKNPHAVGEDDDEAVEEGEESDYDSMTVDELSALCDESGLEVRGSGAGGKVLKKDYIKALKKNDKGG